MPDDHEDGSTDRDDGFLLASSSSDASVAFAEEGVGPSGADGRFTEDPGEVLVKTTCGLEALAKGEPGQRTATLVITIAP
jgi:hypothetical protein